MHALAAGANRNEMHAQNRKKDAEIREMRHMAIRRAIEIGMYEADTRPR